MKDKSIKFSKVALSRSYFVKSLIDKLNNTTIGSLDKKIDNNSYDIKNLEQDKNKTNKDITILNTKIDSLANIFGVSFNADGTIKEENYSTHNHMYVDTNNNKSDIKITKGVNK